ncbi:MAG: hypothetical protein PUG80_03330 [Eubacteriales bacterium]|nr:hypothetical protein [Eubacteriales bacterium]MDY5347001.1 hypothetical protein [Eubacteriales bacterium]
MTQGKIEKIIQGRLAAAKLDYQIRRQELAWRAASRAELLDLAKADKACTEYLGRIAALREVLLSIGVKYEDGGLTEAAEAKEIAKEIDSRLATKELHSLC